MFIPGTMQRHTRTWLFRDAGQLQQLARWCTSRKRPVSILSAGCSRGDEAVSMVLLLLEAGVNVTVVAVDEDPDVLTVAQQGEFDEYRVHNLHKELLHRYFDRIASSAWKPKPEVWSRVSFRFECIEFLGDDKYDVVLARNVFWHSGEKVAAMLRSLKASTAADGILACAPADLVHARPWRHGFAAGPLPFSFVHEREEFYL